MRSSDGVKRNRFEAVKADKDALSLASEIDRFASLGLDGIEQDDLERLKIWGIALRQRTPGFFMMRVRVPAGRTNAVQCRALGQIANRFGKGMADITTRGQIQLRWIRIENVPEIFHLLHEAGLATLQTLMDSVRNIRGCPFAGLTPHEYFDATPVIHELEQLILGQQDTSNLPRKMNITITGCAGHCCDAHIQDLSLVPAVRQIDGRETMGFNVLIGGKISSGDFHAAVPLDVFVTADEAARFVREVITIFHEHGPRQTRTRTRLVYLLQEWGLPRFRDELERRLGGSLLTAGEDLPNDVRCETVGIIPQKQPGVSTLGLLVPAGRLTGDQLIELARLAETYGQGDIRLTAEQNVIVPHIPNDRINAMLAEPIVRDQLPYKPHAAVRGTVSCTGIDYCSLAVIETKQRALKLARELEQRVPEAKNLRLHWSGCRAGCGQHLVADIGLLGRKTEKNGQLVEAVDVYVGGSPGPDATPAIKLLDAVPCDELVDVLEGIVRYGDFAKFRQQFHQQARSSAAAI